ncbi:MAG: hypothetical protein US83_C0004G0099 [Candidatus Falkowbacteria bacterium GW2011_GWC2_38_22]|uniref:Protein NO VEIN C-terminal domain-containing protein n=1 Tax=Candidatus Falkowbacteria bacterium GW2011_GWE1_38_31 TaxID=1618638 RepID=A0A0G0JSK3_9BACT|nr:MAG: hypothetical protein US73_C0002G0018 [Candidatus Falkowbacteria bacterium GW2011_GWF2_38_1205]KKQ61715.1 MAG: hypothetical protein US83_C0004G0099 [Candidatus Falkowbacteria bacterium GW2011_GWC2_38_22]KKQ63670.1 MAG: hypothetical protein US84_C0004G0018 [Candidatus Falkowbacteria bacterium GW2011_GWF1_38_22]KKQ65914.1 MAG: hypothetical protein US87_C0004G0099 [Candidatus Falkowbacteria bacterium GW2011_GWE2_38_254]KKQ70533.1 MAG: hypothetical protein US91_C0004G0018 [Candidatus Falkowb
MLKELSKYDNLGTPNYFWELFDQFKSRKGKWNVEGVEGYFKNRLINGRVVFDGCLPFLLYIKIIELEQGGGLCFDETFSKYLRSEEYICCKILERLFLELKYDPTFDEIFISENISYDIVYRYIQIKNSAFRLKYSNFKQLLIDFRLLFPHPDLKINKLIVNAKYRRFFDLLVLPEIKGRKIGLDNLHNQLEEKRLNGELAENYVLEFEKDRLGGSKNMEIEKISDYDVSAGYDIVSFESPESGIPNRFIEVKCYTGEPSFYWSRNEIDVARIKRDEYYIYLVDKNSLGVKGYSPITIRDPHKNVFNDKQWNKRAEKYFITMSK